MTYISNDSLTVQPQNVVPLLREEFSTLDTSVWDVVTGSGDIVQIEGNVGSISYITISKDPLTADTESYITSKNSYTGTLEFTSGLSISQRVQGQEPSIEVVSTDTPLSAVADVAIASIQQTTTTLTVGTTLPHGLAAGSRVSIYGVSDSRFNYPNLVVSSVNSPNSFNCTAGAVGTITSVTAGPYTNQGFVRYRPALRYATDGFGIVYESTSATSASFYTRAGYGEVYPSGVWNGNHSSTCATTTGVQQVGAAYAYAFIPATEYRFVLQNDKLHFIDTTADGATSPTVRLIRTNLLPPITKSYKLRYRAVNNKSLTVPVARIVSSTKTGTTTATIVTDAPHGLTAADTILINGNRDSTNFASTTTGIAVVSIVNSTTFTAVYGTAVTATTYGGMVSRLQGANIPASYSTIAIQSAAVTATELTLVGSGTWTWSVGDYVNVHGCRDNTTGASMNVDGAYRVVNVITTTLVLQPIGSTTLPTAFTTTNCGGTTIKRTDMRISTARIYQYLRDRVEIIPNSSAATSISVIPAGGTISTVSTVSSASLAATSTSNDITSAALTATSTSGTISPSSGSVSQEYNVIVTAVSGTNPTMDVVVQESDDSGTNWYDIYHFPRITAAGQYRSPLIPLVGNRVRYVRTVSGTTPSITNAVNRLLSNMQSPLQRQFFDRTIDPNTINSVTGSYFIDGCVDLNIFVATGAVTTSAAVLILEVSPDNINWVQVGADITTAATTNSLLQVTNALGRFARLRTKTAGIGTTLTYVMIKGVGR